MTCILVLLWTGLVTAPVGVSAATSPPVITGNSMVSIRSPWAAPLRFSPSSRIEPSVFTTSGPRHAVELAFPPRGFNDTDTGALPGDHPKAVRIMKTVVLVIVGAAVLVGVIALGYYLDDKAGPFDTFQ